ncbi:MAG: FliH/SctL family protein [Alphaproteobacteria bacterium]|jgi:flagellar assembly protein FliH
MVKEYKFMFDRRFDEPEEEATADEAPLSSSAEAPEAGTVPSIAEILDTLTARFPEDMTPPLPEETPEPEENEPPAPEEPPPGEVIREILQEPRKPPAPTFSQEEMEAAKAAAFQEGLAKGTAEGREGAWKEAMDSVEKQEADTMERIAEELKKIRPVLEETPRTAFVSAVRFAMAVCRKVAPALSEKEGLEEIRSLLEKNFHFLKEEPKITVRIHPDLAEAVKKNIAEIVVKNSFPGKIAVVRDETLLPGDCRIEWKNGGLERKTEDVLNQAEELVKLYAAAIPAEQTATPQTAGEKNG